MGVSQFGIRRIPPPLMLKSLFSTHPPTLPFTFRRKVVRLCALKYVYYGVVELASRMYGRIFITITCKLQNCYL